VAWPRERGLTLEETIGATLTRFLPASIISVGAVGLWITYSSGLAAPLGEILFLSLLFSGLLSIGFLIGLEGLRRWFYPRANVSGHRSVAAGLLSPFAWLASLFFSVPGGGFGASLLVGVLLALGMFFPWLTRDTETRRGEMDPVGPKRGAESVQGPGLGPDV
jgi:hypothetical protein